MNGIFSTVTHFIKQELSIVNKMNSLSNLQKKVLLAVIALFATITIACLIRYFSTKKFKEQKNDTKITPLVISLIPPSDESIPKQASAPEKSDKANDLKQPTVSPNIANPISLDKLNSKKSRQEILIDVRKQIDSAAPNLFPDNGRTKHLNRFGYHQQIERLQKFLIEKEKNPVEMDLIYVCVGHGRVAKQAWPSFIFETLQSAKKVGVYLFEDAHKYSADQAEMDLIREYEEYLNEPSNEKAICKLSSLSIKQFVCGFPDTTLTDNKYEKSMTQDEKTAYTIAPDIYWESRQQAIHMIEKFNKYVEKILAEGKKVVLGDHRGALNINNDLVILYNQLVKKHPGQIYFYKWNVMTHQAIKKEDLIPKTNF